MALSRTIRGARALATAQLQSAWNGRVKTLGVGGSMALTLITIGLYLLAALGTAAATLGLGFLLGSRIEEGHGRLTLEIVFFVLIAVAPLGNAVLGVGRALEPASLARFPLRASELLLVELLARFIDPLAIGVALALVFGALGVGISAPSLVPPLILAVGLGLLTYAGLELLITQLIGASLRRAGRFLVLIAMVSAPALLLPLTRAHNRGLVDALRWIGWAPSSLTADAIFAWGQGRFAMSAGLFTGALLVALGLLAAALFLTARETRSPSPAVSASGSERTWTFREPWVGVARLQLAVTLDSTWGRFMLVMPVLVPLVLRSAISQIGQFNLSIVALAYIGAANLAISMNQFGFEGPALGGVFILPVRAQDLWIGKRVCFQAIWFVQCSVASLLLVALGGNLADGVAGLAISWGVFLFQNMIGQLTSVWFPRSFPRRSLRQPRMPLLIGLVNLAIFILVGGTFGVIYLLMDHFAPAALVPALVLVALALEGLWWVELPHTARLLDQKREQILLGLK